MIILENNTALLNDIVFESRNKNYGAYAIRSEYGNTILKSLGVTILFFASISILAVWLNNTAEVEKKIVTDVINIVTPVDLYVEPVAEPIKKQVAPPVTTPVASNPNTTAVSTVISDATIEHPSDHLQANDGAANINNNPGNPADVMPGDGANPSTGVDGGLGKVVAPSPVEKFPDVMPSLDNMGAFLQKNLKYPPIALGANASGRVIINFIIDEEGKIESANVLKGIGYGCDEEALRVIKAMPKWKPGMKNSKPVKVSFSLPIVFKLQ